jgi:adenylate cyclase
MSPDPSDEYFADGITEELIATISKIREVSVVSRTSVMQYRKNPKTIHDVAGELQAGTILEGSVRKAGNQVRVTVQLVNGEQDRHEWAESYDRKLDDIFAIQSDISQKVAEVLRVQLLANEKERLQKVPTRSVDAYTLFLKGRSHLNERTHQGFQKAIGYFEEAVKRDPRYASAFAGLSDTYMLLENWGSMSPRDAWPLAMQYAVKALEIDDTLAEAHTSMATCLTFTKWDWKGAEREYRRALELSPSYATGHHWYAFSLLQVQRRWVEAIREIAEAAKLDPFSSIIAVNKARILLWAGRREEALGEFRLALKLNPEFAFGHAAFGTALVSTSSVKEGTSEIEKALTLWKDNVWMKAQRAYAYMAADMKSGAERILRELGEMSREKYVPETVIASVHAVLGEKDEALELLNKAVQENTGQIVLLHEPMFDGLRTDPRFKALLERIGLPQS